MSEQVRSQRTYGEKEVAQILKRAAGMQRTEAHAAGALTLNEIEVIARDAGIDPEQVRAAVRELEEKRAVRGPAAGLFGAPLKLVIERTVPVALEPAHHEALAAEIKRALGGAGLGQTSVVGRTLSHSVHGRAQCEVTVAPAGNQTSIRVEASFGNLAGGLFGGIVGGVGGGFGPNLGWLLPVHLGWHPLAGVAAAAGFIGATWLACRAMFRSMAGGQQRKLTAMVDAMEAALLATRR